MASFRRIFAPLLTTLPLLFVAASAQPETPAEVVPVSVAPAGEALTLDQAIQMALAKNFSIKVSGFNASIAAAGVTEALGKFDPVLSGSYTHAENRNPLLTFSAPNLRDETRDQTDAYEAGVSGLVPWGLTYKLGGTTTNYRGTFNGYADNWDSFAGVSATQPLLRDFGFGATLASIRIARTNRSISDWQFRQSVIDTVTQVIRTYHDLNYANAFLRSALRSRELASGLLTENEKRYKIGSMSEYDVTFARSNLAETEETILFAQRQVLDTENFLKQLITDDRTTALLSKRLVIETPAPAPIVVVDPAADFRIALDHRPDYQQAKLISKRSGINSRQQLNQLLPRVDLVGSYGYNGLDTDRGASRRMVQDKDYRSYSWGVVASVPLTFTTERGRYRAAKLQERQAETQLQQVEQNIVVQVGNAAGQIETAQKRIQADRRARELAQATLTAEEKRLRFGQTSTYQVSQYQRFLSQAEVAEASAHADYAKSLAEYDRQLGVTLEKLHISIDPPR